MSWLFLDKIVYLGTSFFTGIYVANYLGASDFGLFSYGMSFVAVFGGFASLGMNDIIVKKIVDEEHDEGEVLGSAFFMHLVVSLGIVFVTYVIASRIHGENALLLWIIVLFSCQWVIDAFSILEYYFHAHTASKYYSSARIVGIIVSAILKILLVYLEAPLIWFVVATLAQILIQDIIIFVSYTRFSNISFFAWRFRKSVAKNILKESWPLMFSGAALLLYTQIDTIMIKNMMDDEAVGVYAVAIKLGSVFFFLPRIITDTLYPLIIKARKVSIELYYKRLQTLYEFMFWLAISLIIIVNLTSETVVGAFFNDEYVLSSGVLNIYMWSCIPIFCSAVQYRWLLIEGKQYLSLVAQLVVLGVNFILNYFLIKSMGINGAALATLLSQVLSYLTIATLFHARQITVIHLKAASFSSLRRLMTKGELF